MRRAYWVYSAIVLGWFALAQVGGFEIGSPRRGVIPASVRQSPGGYRSYSFWGGGK